MLQLNIFHKAARHVKASGKSAIAITVLFVVSTSSALAALPSIGEFTSDMTKKDGLIPDTILFSTSSSLRFSDDLS